MDNLIGNRRDGRISFLKPQQVAPSAWGGGGTVTRETADRILCDRRSRTKAIRHGDGTRQLLCLGSHEPTTHANPIEAARGASQDVKGFGGINDRPFE